MGRISIRTWVLTGFVISIIGIFLNVPIVAELNNKIRDVETEISNIKESLRTQANEISRADLEDSFFTILSHLSDLQKAGDDKIGTNADAVYLRQSFLKKAYAAANEIPSSEVLKEDVEQMAIDIKNYEKALEVEKAKTAGNSAEYERLLKEAEALSKENENPKSELGKKMKEVVAAVDPDTLSEKSGIEIVLAGVPAMKAITEKFIENFEQKEKKLKELEARKEYLSWWSTVLTYLAVSLQLFGLLCVLNKDLPVQVIKDDIAEVKDDTKEVLSEVKNIQNESQEARDLLEELEEDLRSAIEKVDKQK